MSKTSPWLWSQFKEWADSVDRKLNILLMDSKKKPIDEALERAINRTWAIARRIDLKVPDLGKQQTKEKE
jgi:hypothetical protein